MYAVVRRNSFSVERVAAAQAALREFDEIHAAQPGYVGTLAIEEADGRRLVVNLWEDEQHAIAALPAVGPAVRRLLAPLMSRPSELVGTGEVIDGPWEFSPDCRGRR